MGRKHHRFVEDSEPLIDPIDLLDIDDAELSENPYYRKRIEQELAAAQVSACLYPLCDRPAAKQYGPGTVLCLPHAFKLWCAMDDRSATTPAMTEHRLKRELRERRLEEKRRAESESAAIEPGWIYYLRVDDRIKIGFSADVRRRMRSYPPNAQLLAVHPGTMQLEREMHAQFAGHLAQGREWFRPDAEVMAHIDGVLSQFGSPPPAFIYRYREGTQQQIKVHRRSRR